MGQQEPSPSLYPLEDKTPTQAVQQEREQVTGKEELPPVIAVDAPQHPTEFRTFGAQEGLIGFVDMVEAWADSQPLVQRLLEFSTTYAPLFTVASGAVTVVGFVYGLYTNYMNNKKAEERTERIIREMRSLINQMVSQVEGMIKRAEEDIKNHIDEVAVRTHLENTKANQRRIQTWLLILADSDFTNVQTGLATIIIADCDSNISHLESALERALTTGNAAIALAVYKHLTDAYQSKNQVFSIIDVSPEPQTSNIVTIDSINRILAYHTRVLAAIRTTLRLQFDGPIQLGPSLENLPPVDLPAPGSFGDDPFPAPPPPPSFSYSFRGALVNMYELDPSVVIAMMERHIEEDYLKHTEYIRPLEGEHRKALNEIQQLN